MRHLTRLVPALLAMLLLPAAGHAARTGFTATAASWPDPERGWYRATTPLDRVGDDELTDVARAGIRLIYPIVRLDAFRSRDLPETFLADLERGFDRVRRHGLKVILRFAYNYPDAGEDYRRARDAPLAQVLRHIEQLGPSLRRNGDLILAWQAGFIGAWGEWHSSSNGLDQPAAKVRIRDALLAARPDGVPIHVRYPPDLARWYARPADAVARRIGFHNDCFLADDTDVGTFEQGLSDPLRAFAARIGRGAGFGGETCEAGDPGAARFSCAALREEARAYGLVYLNRDYAPSFLAVVERDCLAEVSRSIGLRPRLVALDFPDTARAGEAVDVRLEIANDGWARALHPRPVELLLRRAGAAPVALRVAGADLAALRGSAPVTLVGTVRLPASLAAGRHEVWLRFPDRSPRLAADRRYAVRPGNADAPARGQRWDATLAAFATGAVLIVR